MVYLVLVFLTDLISLGWVLIILMQGIQNIMGFGRCFRSIPRSSFSSSGGKFEWNPGKIDVSGDSVAHMWSEGKLNEIVAYNEFDAFTTHLLWARVAHFSGLLSGEEYTKEQKAWFALFWRMKFQVVVCI